MLAGSQGPWEAQEGGWAGKGELGWEGRATTGAAQEDADGVGGGCEEVPHCGPDGMTRDQLMAIKSRG